MSLSNGNFINLKQNVLITGATGVGKSFTMQKFYQEQIELMDKNNIRLTNIKASYEAENKAIYNELRVLNNQLKKERDNFYLSIERISINRDFWKRNFFILTVFYIFTVAIQVYFQVYF